LLSKDLLSIGNEDSVSLGSSLVSLAERGTMTPARQRTVTEVIWPEQMAALNSGLRSRLSSSTSLFRAGSQKSIAGPEAGGHGIGGSYALGRRESQRSVSDWTKPLYVSVASTSPGQRAGTELGSPSSGWRSEQGSPRRPASLILSGEQSRPQEWMEPTNKTVESPERDNRPNLRPTGDGTPLGTASPSVQTRRFYTTQVEPEQVILNHTFKFLIIYLTLFIFFYKFSWLLNY